MDNDEREALERLREYDDPDIARIADTLLRNVDGDGA